MALRLDLLVTLFWRLDRDEELLVKGIEMNDSLQLVLAKHDALASGAPLPTNGSSVNVQPHELANSSLRTSEAGDKNPAQDAKSSASAVQGEEEEEDEFAQLARRFLFLN